MNWPDVLAYLILGFYFGIHAGITIERFLVKRESFRGDEK